MKHDADCRSGRRLTGAAAALFAVLLTTILMLPTHAAQYQIDLDQQLDTLPRTLTYTLTTPDHELITTQDGHTSIVVNDFHQYGLPGDPALPAALYKIALPPLVPLGSVAIEIDAAEQIILDGVYDIDAVGPFMSVGGLENREPDWGPNAAAIIDGKNVDIYGKASFYPEKPVTLDSVAHLRKWRLARLLYQPFSYDPVNRQLRLTTRVTVTIRYDEPVVHQESYTELQNVLMDGRAAETLYNYEEARAWYDRLIVDRGKSERVAPGYAIITTHEIRTAIANSGSLGEFVAHKQALGYDVWIVTEYQYGFGTPAERVEQVRDWLGDHYEADNIQYALLIGNPDPDDPDDAADEVGDLPMKYYNGTPTDFYFADLYATAEELDYEAEVYVGRIPVYQSAGDWVAVLDSILRKTINYENEADTGWRRSALLPMAFLGTYADGAEMGEYMKTDYLDDAGFSSYRLYWHGALAYSEFQSEAELVEGATAARWLSNPPGIVTWYGHGNPSNSAIYEEYSTQTSHTGRIIDKSEVHQLNNGRPAMTFQNSCSTGKPEAPDNLGYVLLRNGAVGTVSAARDGYGWPGQPPDDSAHGMSLGYNYVHELVENVPMGVALFASKSTPGGYVSNALAYNLYGDPSVRLLAVARAGTEAEIAQPATPLAAGAAPDLIDAQERIEAPAAAIALPARGRVSDVPFDMTSALDQSGKILANEPDRLISMGQAHNCAIRPAGGVDCQGEPWGFTIYWQQAQDQPDPYVQVSAGLYQTCGLRPDGSVHCWGRGDYDMDVDRPGPYAQISATYLHGCGLLTNGDIECWGNNDAGQAPETVYGPFVQVSAGLQHTCGLRADGSVDCWGRNSFGQANDRTGPFIQIDSGYFHTCGLTTDRSIDCWGSNYLGQSADAVGPFSQVSVGWFNTCGLLDDGSVDCWGSDQYGQSQDQAGPYARISTGLFNSVGLRSDGTLGFWGGYMQEVDQPGPYGQYVNEMTRMLFMSKKYGAGTWYTAIHIADMTSDGAPEVLIGNRSTNSLEIWRYSDSSESLTMMNSIEFPYHIHDIKVADLNGDGALDLVAGLRSRGLYVSMNMDSRRSIWEYDTPVQIDSGYSLQVSVADFDLDGHVDILHGVDYGPIRTFYGDGTGAFSPGHDISVEESQMRFTTGFNVVDLDGDDYPDLMGTDGSFLRVFLNPGVRDSAWESIGPTDNIGTFPCCDPVGMIANTGPSAADFDGNGLPDQVAFLGTSGREGPLEILLFSTYIEDSAFYWDMTVVDSLLYPGWAGLTGVADIDGDGNADIYVGGWDQFAGLHVYFGDGNGGFSHETVVLDYGVGERNSLAVVDITGDHVNDILVGRFNMRTGNPDGFELLVGMSKYAEHIMMPAQARTPGTGWKIGMQAQNAGGNSADVRLLAFGEAGQRFGCGEKAMLPGASVNYQTNSDCGGAPFAIGSAAFEVSQPSVAIANISNWGSGGAGGQYRGVDLDQASNRLSFPLVKHNHAGRTTTFQIQNTSAFTNWFEVRFIVKGEEYVREYDNVPPNATVLVGPYDLDIPAGLGQVGSLTVSGRYPLAGVSVEHQHNVAIARNLQASNAFVPDDYDTVMYCPLYRNAHTEKKLTTGVQVQNVSQWEAQTVEFTYTTAGQQVVLTRRIEPGASATFYAGDPALGIPAGTVGSVTVRGQDLIAAVVNDADERSTFATYSCFGSTNLTRKVSLPLYKEFYLGNTTGIQVQNAATDGRAATLTVTYYPIDPLQGTLPVKFRTKTAVPAGSSFTFWGVSLYWDRTLTLLEGNPAQLGGKYGSAVIESNTPIAVMANESSYGVPTTEMDSKSYEGFNR